MFTWGTHWTKQPYNRKLTLRIYNLMSNKMFDERAPFSSSQVAAEPHSQLCDMSLAWVYLGGQLAPPPLKISQSPAAAEYCM